MSSFSQLFQKSQFAALQKNQVITSPLKLRLKGEWGLKTTLPTPLSPFITITEDDQTKNAFHRVSRIERIKENFSFSNQSKIPGLPNTLTWNDIKARAITLKTKSNDLINDGHKLNCSDLESVLGIPANHIHAPIYSSPIVDKQVPVKGRLLNQIVVNSSHSPIAVGIAGIVCYLPFSEYVGSQQASDRGRSQGLDRSRLYDFWVLDAKTSPTGDLEIIVTMKKPSSSTLSNPKGNSSPRNTYKKQPMLKF